MSEEFTSGSCGPKTKSDCLVSVSRSKGFQVDIQTDGDNGEALDNAVRLTLDRLQVDDVRVEVNDRGAAPFVLAARLESALREMLQIEDHEPIFEECLVRPSKAHRPRRSRLYVPANRPRFFEKALASGADGIILDLEDSVAPRLKLEARIMASHALRALDFGETEIMVRINQGEEGLRDLEWIVPQPVQHILIPKVETAGQVEAVRNECERIAARVGRRELPWLMPIIESPLGVFNSLAIAGATDGIVSLTLGLQDLTAELGVRPTDEGRESFTARSMIVLAARARHLQPIDTVYADVKNEDGLRASVREARELGFVGKGCIHPAQVAVINEGFLPTPDELERAMTVVIAMEKAEQEGLGAITVGTKMVDPPVAKQSLNLVETALRLGLIEADWRSTAR